MKTGKYVNIDFYNSEALGVCDYSGFIFNRKDLVRQMEWRGDRLCWTGFYVGKPFADQPNAQLKPPILKPDPLPVKEPRPQQYFSQAWAQQGDVPWQFQSNPWSSWGGFESDVPAPSEAQRQINLQTVYFGAF